LLLSDSYLIFIFKNTS